MPQPLSERDVEALRWIEEHQARPVLKVRCGTAYHRVGEVYRTPGGLLWRGRLPQPSTGAWNPAEWPRALPPVAEPQHWSEAGWHTIEHQGPGDWHLYWGCRCLGEPSAWLWEDIAELAEDRSVRETVVWG